MDGFCYRYDGTFAGFLCCARDIYQYKEPANLFLPQDDPRPSLYGERWVETDEDLARRVYRRLTRRLGQGGMDLVTQGFLTCLDHRERRLLAVIDLGLRTGPGVERRLGDEQVLQVSKAVRNLQREADHLFGFVRFADCGGVLVGSVAPKNQVLPLLRVHFCDRLANERFALYDRTHCQLLLHQPGPENGGKGRWVILEARDFTVPPPGAEERAYQDLWRRFYDTLAIPDRYNPRCRQSHMPKRFWGDMTEFQHPASGGEGSAGRGPTGPGGLARREPPSP